METGLIFVFLSTQIANIYRLYMGKPSEIASYVLLIGLVLMMNKDNKISINKKQCFLLVYQFYTLFLAVWAKTPLMRGTTGSIYILFIVMLIFVSATIKQIDGDRFVFLMWLITGILNTLISAYFIREGIEQFNSYFIGDVMLADRSVLATVGYFHILAMITYQTKNKFLHLLKAPLIVAALYNIVITMRRGMFVTLAIILLLHLYLMAKVNINAKVLFRSILIVIVLYILYLKVPYVHLQVDKMLDSANNALNTLLGKKVGSEDLAAAIRVQNRNLALDDMKKFSVINWLFGKGYNAKWIDFPFLQCFYDMGILGGLFYIATQLLPFCFFAEHRRNMQNHEKLLFYLFIISFVNNFYSGIPYGMGKFMYIVPLLANWENSRKTKSAAGQE